MFSSDRIVLKNNTYVSRACFHRYDILTKTCSKMTMDVSLSHQNDTGLSFAYWKNLKLFSNYNLKVSNGSYTASLDFSFYIISITTEYCAFSF